MSRYAELEVEAQLLLAIDFIARGSDIPAALRDLINELDPGIAERIEAARGST